MASTQEANTFYNIDIYNDNSTGGDISSKYAQAFNAPLLINTSDYDVCVARARIPLDQIPLSQSNIPFQKWEIEIGVPVIGSPPHTYTYYKSFVPQFNQISTTTANFNIGINGLNLQTTSLPQNEPTTTQTLTLTEKVPALPNPVEFYGNGYNGNSVSNTVSGLTYTAIITSNVDISRYNTLTGAFIDTVNVPTSINRPNVIILGICMPPNSDKVYVCSYDPDGGGSHLLSDIYNFPVGLDLGIASPQIVLHSMSCSTGFLTIGYEYLNVNYNRNFQLTGGSIVSYSSHAGGLSSSFLDSDGTFFVGSITQFNHTFTQRNITTNDTIETYTIPISDFLDRFIGTDIYGNLLVSTVNTATNLYTIRAYGKSSTTLKYDILMGSNRPLFISNMIMTTAIAENTSPYIIQNINDYIRQINLTFVAIMAQIPLPLSSPQLVPFLEFNSGTSIISLVTDSGCWSANPALTNPACVINFNQLLWTFFKFVSIPAVYTALPATGGQVRTIEINKASTSQPSTSITPQPNSTLYRFSDLTRIVIGTSKMGVFGDVENNSKLLINLGDFTVDTSDGIPNLVIYNPTVLRFYKLFQTTPLTNIDVFISYANRAGEIFPIFISPYNCIGLKLLFRNRKLVNQIAL